MFRQIESNPVFGPGWSQTGPFDLSGCSSSVHQDSGVRSAQSIYPNARCPATTSTPSRSASDRAISCAASASSSIATQNRSSLTRTQTPRQSRLLVFNRTATETCCTTTSIVVRGAATRSTHSPPMCTLTAAESLAISRRRTTSRTSQPIPASVTPIEPTMANSVHTAASWRPSAPERPESNRPRLTTSVKPDTKKISRDQSR